MLFNHSKYKPNSTPVICGYALALSKASAAECAFAAAKLVLGQLHLVEPRVSQAARLARVSAGYVQAALEILHSGNLNLESAVFKNELSLLEASVLARHPQRNLTEQSLAATPLELEILGKHASPEVIWDSMVVPNL